MGNLLTALENSGQNPQCPPANTTIGQDAPRSMVRARLVAGIQVGSKLSRQLRDGGFFDNGETVEVAMVKALEFFMGRRDHLKELLKELKQAPSDLPGGVTVDEQACMVFEYLLREVARGNTVAVHPREGGNQRLHPLEDLVRNNKFR